MPETLYLLTEMDIRILFPFFNVAAIHLSSWNSVLKQKRQMLFASPWILSGTAHSNSLSEQYIFFSLTSKVTYDVSLVLELTVWDKDVLGKDFLGQVKIPITDLKTDPFVDSNAIWHPLIPRTFRDKVHGDLKISVGYVGEFDEKFKQFIHDHCEPAFKNRILLLLCLKN